MKLTLAVLLTVFLLLSNRCDCEEIEIINPGFEDVSRPLKQGEITNGAGGAGVLVGTSSGFFEPPQFEDLVEIPGWRTFLSGNTPIFSGVMHPPVDRKGNPFLQGHIGDNVATVRNVWMQQTLHQKIKPNTRYCLSFLCGAGLWEPGDGVFVALLASPDVETLAFLGVPGVTTLSLSNFTTPPNSEGIVFAWTLEYMSPQSLPIELINQYIAISFVGGDGITLMNFDEFRLIAESVGDVNQDGQVDLLDVQPFVEILLAADFQFAADINQDGAVDLLDVAPFVALLSN